MTSSQRVSKLAAIVIATLMASAAIAEDMKLPGPSGDCLSKALAQLSLDTAACAGRYPTYSVLYGECITGAHQAYAGAIKWCVYVSGGKLSGLRGSEASGGKRVTLNRL